MIGQRPLQEPGDTASSGFHAHKAGRSCSAPFVCLKTNGSQKTLSRMFLAEAKETLFEGTRQRGQPPILKQIDSLSV